MKHSMKQFSTWVMLFGFREGKISLIASRFARSLRLLLAPLALLCWERSSLAVFSILLAVSCARVPVRDSEWCGDLAEQGAACFHTHNESQRRVPKAEWDKERKGMFCTKSDNFIEWQAIILKLCRASGNRCTYEDKKKIVAFFGKAKEFSGEQYAFSLELMEKNIQLDQDLNEIQRDIEDIEEQLDRDGVSLM